MIQISDEYLLYVTCRALAQKHGYKVVPGTRNGSFGFEKPGVPNTVFGGQIADPCDAWVEAARSIVEDAARDGVNSLISK